MKKPLVIVLFFIATLSFGQKIPFQGRLLDNERPFNGTATIDFSIASASWSESQPNVEVVNGYYAVVLGELTPLPEDLFKDTPEVELTITVNSQALTPITLYSPLRPFTGANPLEIDTVKTSELQVTGEGDNLKAAMGTFIGGYEAAVQVYDSLNGLAANIFSTGDESTGYTNGRLLLYGREAGNLRSAVVTSAAAFGRANSFVNLYGQNSDGNGFTLLTDLYASDTDETGTQNPTGYRRGGVDFSNYYGVPTHNIYSVEEGTISKSNINLWTSDAGANQKITVFMSSGDSAKDARVETLGRGVSVASMGIENDPGGSDPNGAAGGLILFGDDSFNFHLTANKGEDHDLAEFNMYGSYFDGAGQFWYNSGRMSTNRTVGGDEYGVLGFNNTTSGGVSTLTSVLTGNLFESGGGGLELYNANGAARVILNGATGNISVNREAGGSAVNLFDNGSGAGGLAIQNAGDGNMMLANGELGQMDFRDFGGIVRVRLDGPNAGVSVLRGDGSPTPAAAMVDDGTGAGLIVAENAGGGNMMAYSAATGLMEMRDFGGSTTVSFDSPLGNIFASGDINGSTLTSSDGSVQTSDRRLKKNIRGLENPLSKTLQMRGVSYQWKDDQKSQRQQIGVIAQEVEEIYPEFVRTNEKGMKAVNYAQMTAVLIEAIKELNAKVEKLESENANLKASLSEVQQLRKEMDQLMKVLGATKAASK